MINPKLKRWLRRLYEAIPGKIFFYKILRRCIRLPFSWHEYFYFQGVFKTSIGKSSFKMMNYGYRYHVENHFFWGGIKNGWEKESSRIWIGLCNDAEVIFDIGANTGCYALIAKTINRSSQIYAFEPMDSIFKKLSHNVKLNSHNISLHKLALSDFTGKAKIFPTSLDHVYSVSVNKNLFVNEKVYEEEIDVIRLEDFIEHHKINKIDVMKLDVETHEPQVLKGMGKYLKQFMPDMIIEIQSNELGYEIENLLSGLQYEFYSIDETKGILCEKNLRKANGLNFLICKPETSKKLRLK
ncbi:MAG: FkbM family methyltransferase [Bacteroidia bacterium]|nr:FkbM family methyltransferase [Bacteroidia bacterium]